jgi:hypothetical protein
LSVDHFSETAMNALRWRRPIGAEMANGAKAAHAPHAKPRNRWISLSGTLVVLALLLVTGIAMLVRNVPQTAEAPPIPAEIVPRPELQSRVPFDFAPRTWGMADATRWNYITFNLVELDPGKSFSTASDWYALVDGPISIVVQQGNLTIQPTGPALYYAGEDPGQPPREIPTGQTVSLGPNDGIVFAARDAASGNNLGNEPAVALLGSMGYLDIGSDVGPIDFKNLDTQSNYGMHPLATEGASISIEHLHMEPYDSYVFEPDPDSRYLCVFDQFQMTGAQFADGAVDQVSAGVKTHKLYASTQLTYPPPGPHTIFDFGNDPIDIYFLVVQPDPASAASTT